MPSIPISSLNPLTTVTMDDFVAVVDSASMTTFRAATSVINDFMAASGSNLSASFTSQSISTSYAIYADTSSYVLPTVYDMTSSWAENVVVGAVVGTASLAYNARTASRLEGIGSSYETDLAISTSLTVAGGGHVEVSRKVEFTSSMISPGWKQDAIFINSGYETGTTGYGKVFINENATGRGKLIFSLGDILVDVNSIGPDIDSGSKLWRGILFQVDQAGDGVDVNTSSLLFVRSNGRTYGRYFEARAFSSSYMSQGQHGFYGTASYAMNASYSFSTPSQFPSKSIVGYASSGSNPLGWDEYVSSSVNLQLQTYATLTPFRWIIETL